MATWLYSAAEMVMAPESHHGPITLRQNRLVHVRYRYMTDIIRWISRSGPHMTS